MAVIQKVLLVDDEPDIRSIATLCLQAVGRWVVVTAASGAEAVEVARRERPDVILLDVTMPDMDGPTALARLREHEECRDVPVVFVTARTQPHEVAQLRSAGAAGVIGKPFDPMTLPEEIRRIVAAAVP